MNKLVNKFCNLLMKSGKKARAYALFSESFTLFLREREKILGNTSAHKNVQQEGNVWSGISHTRNSISTLKVCNALERLSQSQNAPRSIDSTSNSKEFLFHHKVKQGLHASLEKGFGDKKLSNKPLMTPKVNQSMENILNVVVENVRPLIEIRRVRVARATYQVPAQISRLKGETLAVRWIIEFANKKKQRDKISLAQALALELASAYRKQGGPRQRRSELHKLAEANRSYIRYRWW